MALALPAFIFATVLSVLAPALARSRELPVSSFFLPFAYTGS
jgi:hypothetical protein